MSPTPVLSHGVEYLDMQVSENPSLVTEDPESAGWLYKMKIHSIKELDLLLTQEKYLEYCK